MAGGIITGGSRGLGEAMALALSYSGAQVALVARDVKRLESVRDAITQRGGTAEIFTGDVTRENDVAAVAQEGEIDAPGVVQWPSRHLPSSVEAPNSKRPRLESSGSK